MTMATQFHSPNLTDLRLARGAMAWAVALRVKKEISSMQENASVITTFVNALWMPPRLVLFAYRNGLPVLLPKRAATVGEIW